MNTTTSNDGKNLDQLRARTSSAAAQIRADLGNTLDDAKEMASDATHNISNDFKELLSAARQSGKGELAAAADRLGAYVENFSDYARDLAGRGKKTAQAAIASTNTYVKENPWQSVAIGAGVGTLVGFAIGFIAARR